MTGGRRPFIVSKMTTTLLPTVPAPAAVAPTVPAVAMTAVLLPGALRAPRLPSDLAALTSADPMTLTLRAFGGTRRLVGALIDAALTEAL